MIKGAKIKEDLLDFLEEHPEISISIDKKDNSLKIEFSEEIKNYSYTYLFNHIVIFYTYKGEDISFSGNIDRILDKYL